MGKRILLFIDSNIKTIPYEVPLLALREKGYELFFLSILCHGSIHEEYRKLNIPVFSMGEKRVTLKHLPRYLYFFRKFCTNNKIDVVFAHLSIPALVALLVQQVIKAKVVHFRHHFNFLNLLDAHEINISRIDIVMDRINARLAKTIIIPSQYIRELIIKYEAVPPSKIRVIPYAYHWSSLLERFASENAHKTKDSFRMLMISRLTKLKRPQLALDVVAQLNEKQINVELIIVGEGEMLAELKEYAIQKKINHLVHFQGFQKDVVPFLLEADILIHPSITEASSSVVKEAGIIGKPVIVCSGVGDFDDYIMDGINGWTVNPNHFVKEAQSIIQTKSVEELQKIGCALRETVLQRFSVSPRVISLYESLLS